ncbi:MAG TPA: hypothetical protein VF988_17175 [Verrucomicrobiae bacterium]
MRNKHGDTDFFKPTDGGFRLVDGVLLLTLLAVFIGLVLLLAK